MRLPSLLLLLAACTGPGAVDDTAPLDDTGDDTGVDTDTPPVGAWTPGPALPDCEATSGGGDLVALSGVLLAPDGPEAGVVVYSRASGDIRCVGADCDTSAAQVVCTEGVISPGLIDTHDHMQYNVLGPWRHDRLFGDRYEWRSNGGYWNFRTAYDEIDSAYKCEIGRWAELRVLASGGTSAVGSSGGACLAGVVRNLDENTVAHGLEGFKLTYSSTTVTDRYDASDGARYTSDLADDRLDAMLNHVAEGVGGRGTHEIDHMFEIGMSGPGQAFVHATDATTEQLARMAATGTSILWSPRSNLDLYGATTPADIAVRMGVPVALGPDWTWSGSANPAKELSCAWDYLGSRGSEITDRELWQMATTDAARVVGLDGVLGQLVQGMAADLAVYEWSNQPYAAVIRSGTDDVRLTIVGGEALYGVPALVDALSSAPGDCETVQACATERRICSRSSGLDQGYDDLEATLSAALGSVSMPTGYAYASELFGVFACEDDRPSCDVSTPSAGDADGDGVPDDVDVCPDAWDPLQADHDGDGQGDACDPCPLDPTSDTCAHDPLDIDGDGHANDVDDCPWHHDPDQADSDGDGKGDACDPCPDHANPGNAGCPATIPSIRNPSHPAHPSVGQSVTVSGVVVTAVRAGAGYFVQDASASEWGGLHVYDGGDAPVKVGDQVTVEGTYEEYYGLTEITSPTTTVTGTAPVPASVSIADPCAIATDGPDAERYESMLVTVTNVSVTNANPDAPSDFNEIEVAGCLRLDDWLCPTCWADQPPVGTSWSAVTGPLVYTFSNAKLTPRTGADLVP